MTRIPVAPRPARVAAVSALGILALAGCATTVEEADAAEPAETSTGTSEASADPTTEATEDAITGRYVDGTYTAEGSYATPESVETVSVTITLADDIVTAVEVTGNPTARESAQYQSRFIGGISDEVVGKSLDEISVSRVAGSSLTSEGFNEALSQIDSEAAA